MRKYYLDNIRNITVLLVVVYHAFYIFNGVGVAGGLPPITQHRFQDAILYLLYPWFMVLLFIVSGMCSKYYLEKHTEKEYLKSRTVKLLVPSTLGLFAFQWIQGYINMKISGAFDTLPEGIPSPVLYVIEAVSGIGVLWFAQILWVFSLLLILAVKLEKGKLAKLCEKANIIVLILLAVPVWAAAQVLNTPVVTVYRFGIYGFAFFLGYFVFSNESVTDQLKKYFLPLDIVAAVLAAVYTKVYFGQNYTEEPAINSPLAAAFLWFACLGILGTAKRFFDSENKFSAFLSKKCWGIYVLHYLPLSACAYLLTTKTQLNSPLIYALVLISGLVGSIVLYEIISRIPISRFLILGIKKKRSNYVLQKSDNTQEI